MKKSQKIFVGILLYFVLLPFAIFLIHNTFSTETGFEAFKTRFDPNSRINITVNKSNIHVSVSDDTETTLTPEQ